MVADPTDATGMAQRIRNDAIDDVLAVIDDNYTDYISNIERRRSSTAFILDVIDLGTGAAIGVTKGERPNQILGIGITAFRGGRRSAELTFYKQQTTPILITKMDDNRAIVLGDILQKRSANGANYSLKAAIRDLVDCYNAGTLVRAFTELSKTTAALAQASQAHVRVLSGPITISSIPSMAVGDVIREIKSHKISLARQIVNAENATPAAPAGAAPATVAAASAARQAVLQPVRLAIWDTIKRDKKFEPAINQVKTDARLTTIINNNIDTNPTVVSERDYLTVIFAVQDNLNNDLDLTASF
jgi:hypothetical protein